MAKKKALWVTWTQYHYIKKFEVKFNYIPSPDRLVRLLLEPEMYSKAQFLMGSMRK